MYIPPISRAAPLMLGSARAFKLIGSRAQHRNDPGGVPSGASMRLTAALALVASAIGFGRTVSSIISGSTGERWLVVTASARSLPW